MVEETGREQGDAAETELEWEARRKESRITEVRLEHSYSIRAVAASVGRWGVVKRSSTGCGQRASRPPFSLTAVLL